MPAQLLGQNNQPQGQEPNIHPGNADKYAELKALRDQNADLARQVQQFGIGLDPVSVLQTRIAALIETLAPSATTEGQATQIAIEVYFETQMAAVLTEMRRHAVTAQLAAGANVPPHMLQDFAQAHGQVPPGMRSGG